MGAQICRARFDVIRSGAIDGGVLPLGRGLENGVIVFLGVVDFTLGSALQFERQLRLWLVIVVVKHGARRR